VSVRGKRYRGSELIKKYGYLGPCSEVFLVPANVFEEFVGKVKKYDLTDCLIVKGILCCKAE